MSEPVINTNSGMRPQPHGESKSFDPWLLWVTVRRTWYWAIPVGLVLACMAGFGVLATFEPRYRAQHLIEANEDFILYKGVMQTVDDLARTEKTIFFNEVVLRPVLSDPALRNAPSLSDPKLAERNIRQNLKVSNAGSRARMTVSYEDSDRNHAAKVCNAIVAAYMRQRSDLDQKRVAILEGLLVPEIDDCKEKVRQGQLDVKDWTIRLKGFDPTSPIGVTQNESRLSLLNQYEGEINDLRVEVVVLESKLKMEESRSPDEIQSEKIDFVPAAFIPPVMAVNQKTIMPADIAAYVNADAKVVEARSQIARYQRLVISMEDSGLDRLRKFEYREFKDKRDQETKNLETAAADAESRAQADLEAIAKAEYEQTIEARKQEIASLKKVHEEQQRIERQNQTLAEIQQRSQAAQALRTLVAEKKSRIEIVKTQLDFQSSKFQQLIGDSAGLQFAQDDLRRATELLNKLEARIAAIRTERRQVNAIRTVSMATPPKDPVEDIPYKKLLGASGLAFMIPMLIGLLWEMKTKRVTDSTTLDLSHGIAPVVGEIAKSPSANAERGSKGRRVFQESVDTMRANLFLAQDTKDSRSIAIVSSMSGEGKSTAASQLAISLAKSSGKTVLLIDADMRCPDQHDHFGLSLEPGLSGVLTKQATLEEAIQTDLGDLIHVLPAGRLKASPHRLMSPDSIKELLDNVLEQYEYVIFDTAPVLSAGETLAIAASVDTTLVCAMRDVTRMDSVIRTTHRLESAGANVAGTIFNGVTPSQYAYRYGDYNYSNFTGLPGAPT